MLEGFNKMPCQFFFFFIVEHDNNFTSKIQEKRFFKIYIIILSYQIYQSRWF